ncbi:Flp family type IVb pilin [Ideonella sp. YS5]|uniref:Flp family type IVb pilin n=1 Tax=Ideonella sp. YS5 TaxID=3453714 RepID=UPI003EEA4F27
MTCLTTSHLCSAALAWWVDEEGVTSIEYGLMAALIVVVCLGVFTAFSDALKVVYQTWTDAVLAALP